MSKKQSTPGERDGLPAFPLYCGPGDQHNNEGMSLRDYFAAKALTLGGEFFHILGNGCNTPKTVAEAAYQIADEMLKARNQ